MPPSLWKGNVPRFRKTAIAAVAVSAVLLTPTMASASRLSDLAEHVSEASSMTWAYYRGGLTDLSPTTEDVWDGARATAVLMGINDETTARVTVRGLPDSAAGEEYGAHLHDGPCGLDDNKAPTVGGHYNVSPPNDLGGPSVVSDQTEVWLDFDVNSDGEARDTAVVPFVPAAGERSITFHAAHTIHDGTGVGTAGAKLACIPLDIKEFASTN
jgi:hypothetical protein